MKPILDSTLPVPTAQLSHKRKVHLYALSPSLLQEAVWLPLRPFLRFFIRLKIEGIEHIQHLAPGVIFAPNHSSEFDPILVPSAMPFLSMHVPFFYLSRGKDSYKHLGWYARMLYGGLFFKICGAYPVETGLHDYEKSLGTHARFLVDNYSVCVFPEGKMQRNGVLAKGRGGASYLAWKTGKPIVPVGISGATNMNIFDLLTRKRTVTIRFGAPLYKEELFSTLQRDPLVNEAENDFTASAVLIMQRIASLLDK